MKSHSVYFAPHPPILLREIGEGKERAAGKTLEGFKKLAQAVAEEKPSTIVFITPHGNSFSNGTCILHEQMLSGNFSSFGHKSIGFTKKVDLALTEKIFDHFEENGFVTVLMNQSTAHRYQVEAKLDHGVMVPMYFIDALYPDYEMVHIAPGFTSLEENYLLGRLMREVLEASDKKILVVCSGDLSHALSNQGPYDFHEDGPKLDQMVKEAIEHKDPLKLIQINHQFLENAAQCGVRSFLMGFGTMDGYAYESEVYSYEGPFGVGYLTGYLKKGQEEVPSLVERLTADKINAYAKRTMEEDEYVALARKSIETYVVTGKRLQMDAVEKLFSKAFIQQCMDKKMGAFVSIHKQGMLRGCIGTIAPAADHLLDEIIYNGISACSQDGRFDPVTEDELVELDIKVDLLHERERIHSKDQLDVKRYGVIVEKGSKRGLLLPNLEGIDDIDEQVSIAMRKAGISSEEGVTLYRFEVERHEVKE